MLDMIFRKLFLLIFIVIIKVNDNDESVDDLVIFFI